MVIFQAVVYANPNKIKRNRMPNDDTYMYCSWVRENYIGQQLLNSTPASKRLFNATMHGYW